MDVAYNQHSERARRKNRSSTNINHLSLAPLTVKLPLNDPDSIADLSNGPVTSSYLEGKSAPTTPRFLAHTAATPRSHSHRRTSSAFGELTTKSKSSANLGSGRHRGSGTSTPRRRYRADEPTLTSRHRNDSDWMLRTGALMSSEAREFKGQAWLVSRQSSISLAAMLSPEEQAFEIETARERQGSRRNSTAIADDELSPAASRRSSRLQSLDHRSAAMTPMDRHGDTYFSADAISGPDFVNLDQKLEELERYDNELDDEAAIRRLVREGKTLSGSWIANLIGWSLFEVEEEDEEEETEDDEDEDERVESVGGRGAQTPRQIEGITNLPSVKVPPPKENEGGWQDAAWLLTVASKVLF